MKRGPSLLVALVAIVALVLTLALTRDGGTQTDADCSRFCVRVVEEDDDVVLFEGSRWRAGSPVDVTYGEVCPSNGFCSDEGLGRAVRVNARGRFRFRLRTSEPARARGVPTGRLPVLFEQWRGRPFESGLIRREAPSS